MKGYTFDVGQEGSPPVEAFPISESDRRGGWIIGGFACLISRQLKSWVARYGCELDGLIVAVAVGGIDVVHWQGLCGDQSRGQI